MNYIGSKLSLLNYIDNTLTDFSKINGKNITFCDIFAGTSSVGKYFKNKGYNIISNDIQYYSYVLAKHYIENNSEIKFEKLKNYGIINPFEYLNNLKDYKGFIENNYTMEGTKNQVFKRQYFTDENAIKIDSIRQKIEDWNNNKLLTSNEYYYLLACLLESSDKVANTASVYEAFLKNVKKSAQKEIKFEPLQTLIYPEEKVYKTYNEDANDLIKKISGDVLYLDPPYNTRKYDTNYHILETIALNDSPSIKGKTGVRVDISKRSRYCQKKEVEVAFEDLIKNSNFKFILLSYNDEGIIPINRIEEIMSKYGSYKRYEQQYRRFKSDNNKNYLKNSTIEYLHCLKKYDLDVYNEIINGNKKDFAETI